jgi:hypothetical protein
VVFGCSFFRFPVVFRCSDLHGSSHHQERPTAWLSAQICNHRGHAVKHGPRWFLVVLSSDFRWFFVVQISTAAATIPTVWRRHHGGFWLLVVQISTVVFGCSDFRWFLVPISTAAVSFFWCETTIRKSKKYNI